MVSTSFTSGIGPSGVVAASSTRVPSLPAGGTCIVSRRASAKGSTTSPGPTMASASSASPTISASRYARRVTSFPTTIAPAPCPRVATKTTSAPRREDHQGTRAPSGTGTPTGSTAASAAATTAGRTAASASISGRSSAVAAGAGARVVGAGAAMASAATSAARRSTAWLSPIAFRRVSLFLGRATCPG